MCKVGKGWLPSCLLSHCRQSFQEGNGVSAKATPIFDGVGNKDIRAAVDRCNGLIRGPMA